MNIRPLLVALFAIALLPATHANAQSYPAKPIRVVVPFAAGSGLDNTVRLMGDRFQKITGQPLIVDNKGARAASSATRPSPRPRPTVTPSGLPPSTCW